jgi:HEAT repeat protein
MEAQKAVEGRQFQEAVTRVTPVTRDLSIVDVEEGTAPTNALASPVENLTQAASVLPDAEWVEGMAAALMANPVCQITNPERSLKYFRSRALAMLGTTPDPYARGLMLGYERHRHAVVVPNKVTGR